MLIVDDQVDVLEVYEDVLGRQLGHCVECCSMPGEALRLVKNRLFDMVIVDAKITHKGAPLGGLNLAEDIAKILGMNSVLLMSQYDVREEVRCFNPAYAFLPKPRADVDLLSWVRKELIGKVRSMVARQYGFVIMPFTDEPSNDWYRTRLTPWMREAGFDVRRMDEMATTRAINQELLARIHDAHFVVLFASRQNANVFFEAGYAWALEKYVVILAPEVSDLPFDMRTNFAISTARNADSAVREEILRLMGGLRGLEALGGPDDG